jgi:hypothetical protein
MQVSRSTDQYVEATPIRLPADGDPLLRLQHETRPPNGPGAARCVGYPQELALRGIPVRCSACLARRDWLLINQGRQVWVHCRCGHQWIEPEITRADFETLLGNPEWTTYPSIDQAMTALGFDGSFVGAYLQ